MKTFEYTLKVTVGPTNMEGNVYWTSYFEWFGVARELFLMNLFPSDVNAFEQLFSQLIMIVTCDAQMKLVKPSYFSDDLVIKINTAKFGKCSLTLLVKIINKKSGDLIAKGEQKLAFCHLETHKFIKIPEDLLMAAKEYEKNKK